MKVVNHPIPVSWFNYFRPYPLPFVFYPNLGHGPPLPAIPTGLLPVSIFLQLGRSGFCHISTPGQNRSTIISNNVTLRSRHINTESRRRNLLDLLAGVLPLRFFFHGTLCFIHPSLLHFICCLYTPQRTFDAQNITGVCGTPGAAGSPPTRRTSMETPLGPPSQPWMLGYPRLRRWPRPVDLGPLSITRQFAHEDALRLQRCVGYVLRYHPRNSGCKTLGSVIRFPQGSLGTSRSLYCFATMYMAS